jgi:hypothetical protein
MVERSRIAEAPKGRKAVRMSMPEGRRGRRGTEIAGGRMRQRRSDPTPRYRTLKCLSRFLVLSWRVPSPTSSFCLLEVAFWTIQADELCLRTSSQSSGAWIPEGPYSGVCSNSADAATCSSWGRRSTMIIAARPQPAMKSKPPEKLPVASLIQPMA